MTNFLTEDITISKKNFLILCTSYGALFLAVIGFSNVEVFSYIYFNDLPNWLFSLGYIAFAIGCIIAGFLIAKNFPIRLFFIFSIFGGIGLLFLWIILPSTPPELMVIGTGVIAPFAGSFMLAVFLIPCRLTELNERGRILGLLNLIGGILLFTFTYLMVSIEFIYFCIILGTYMSILGIINSIFIKDSELRKYEEKVHGEEKLITRDFVSYVFISIITCSTWGIGLSTITVGASHTFTRRAAAYLLGSGYPLFGLEPTFVFGFICISIGAIISSPILGIMADKLGRRSVWLTSISACITGTFLLGLLTNELSITIAATIFGISVSASLIGIITFIADSISGKKLNIYLGVLFGIGWFTGVAIGWFLGVILSPYELTNMTLIALFFQVISYILIMYTKETLPSKEILELKEKFQEVSEDDLMLYKEQKICLVCKGQALGFTFICHECNAVYCEKCAKAILNLDNYCWVCEHIIDESKPTKKLITIEEAKPKIEELKHKKNPNQKKV